MKTPKSPCYDRHPYPITEAMADDLLAILAASRIVIHLERIVDYAKITAKRSSHCSQPIHVVPGHGVLHSP